MKESKNGSRREAEVEGRMSAMEASHAGQQEDIRELTQVVTDLAHETRRSISILGDQIQKSQRPNWQYLAVLLGLVIALGSIYNRDQVKQDEQVNALAVWQLEAVREAGKQEGLYEGLSEQVKILRSETRDLRGGR